MIPKPRGAFQASTKDRPDTSEIRDYCLGSNDASPRRRCERSAVRRRRRPLGTLPSTNDPSNFSWRVSEIRAYCLSSNDASPRRRSILPFPIQLHLSPDHVFEGRRRVPEVACRLLVREPLVLVEPQNLFTRKSG